MSISALPKHTEQTALRRLEYYEDRFLKRNLRPDEYLRNIKGEILIPQGEKQRLENEAASLHFIKSNTNIPVPTVLDAYEHEGCYHLWTEWVPGVMMDTLSPSDQATVMIEVEEHLRTLQNLRSKTVGGPTGIIALPIRIFPPFFTTRNWVLQSSATEDFVFCHNDLAQQNIVVSPETLKIAAILDWESAGWYPPFFEYPFFRNSRGSGWQAAALTDNRAQLREFLIVCMYLSCKSD